LQMDLLTINRREKIEYVPRKLDLFITTGG
jgi:hypothetical protein